jgi:hypothetical protein
MLKTKLQKDSRSFTYCHRIRPFSICVHIVLQNIDMEMQLEETIFIGSPTMIFKTKMDQESGLAKGLP